MNYTIHNSDCLKTLMAMPDESVDCCITSPPYFNLRNYQIDGQIGLEDSPQAYVAKLTEIFHEVKRARRLTLAEFG